MAKRDEHGVLLQLATKETASPTMNQLARIQDDVHFMKAKALHWLTYSVDDLRIM